MGLFAKIRRHVAVAGADFDAMFKDTDTIPPFPAAAARLISELNRPDAQIDEFAAIIVSAPDISTKILQAVNSALVAPKAPITDIHQAVSLLGINRIKQIATAHVVRNALPVPEGELFDHEAFWSDSLLMALMARELAKYSNPSEAEDAFTASLLADIAVPVLLSSWKEYYQPIVELWGSSAHSLSAIERQSFQWDHAQAGAWIAASWDLPEELVCLIGVHNLSANEANEAGFKGTIVDPIRVAAGIGSVLKQDRNRSRAMLDDAVENLGITADQFAESAKRAGDSLEEVRQLFGVTRVSGDQVVRDMLIVVEEKKKEDLDAASS